MRSIVGAGGLGTPVAQFLAAAGIGTITLCDPDAVDLTNLQRQILFATADVGTPKVAAAKARLAAVNAGRSRRDDRGTRGTGRARAARRTPPTSCSTAATTSRRGTR